MAPTSTPKLFARRPGYNPNFLSQPVPLPTLTAEQRADATPLIDDATDVELRYQHFSIVMCRSRRLPFFTAVNIDGRRVVRLKREADRWRFDPRVPREAQLGPSYYSGVDLDFGHLVRRLDPSWGTEKMVVTANNDTFHYTNCAPQHKDFNRNKSTWAGLEDYILDNAIADRDRVTVFTGPVFSADDRLFRQVPLPSAFWKLLALLKRDGTFTASAFIISQFDLIDDLVEKRLTEAEAKTFQVPVQRLERMTQLGFGDLLLHDPMMRGTAKSLDDVPAVVITQAKDIAL